MKRFSGTDLLSIAGEKAGIIKPEYTGGLRRGQSQKCKELFRHTAEERGSKAYFFGADFDFSLKNEGFFDYTGLKQYYSNLTASTARPASKV